MYLSTDPPIYVSSYLERLTFNESMGQKLLMPSIASIPALTGYAHGKNVLNTYVYIAT
jgi:hypothetical protein